MRVVIIVLVLVAATFAVVVVQGGSRPSASTSESGAPPVKNGEIDEDALGNWSPPKIASLIADVSAPFAPKVAFADPRVVVTATGSANRSFASSTSQMRISRVALTSGKGLEIGYDCERKSGRQCPQATCICAPGATFTASELSQCPDGWRKKRSSGEACTKDDDHVSLVVYPEAGAMTFVALGKAAAAANLE